MKPVLPVALGVVALSVLSGLAQSPPGAAAPGPSASPAKPNPEAIAAAVSTLGAANLQTLKYFASGESHESGVAGAQGDVPQRRTLKSYEVSIDYPASGMMVELVREMSPVVAEGEPTIPGSQQRELQGVSGTVAWDATFAQVPTVTLPATTSKPSSRRKVATNTPSNTPEAVTLNPDASAERRAALWITPHGFLKAALGNQPALKPAGSGTEVSFYIGKQRYLGFINSKNQVERVRTWVAQPGGDVLIDTTYTEYQPFGTTMFPTHIVQTKGGQQALDLIVSAVQPNVAVRITAPQEPGRE